MSKFNVGELVKVVGRNSATKETGEPYQFGDIDIITESSDDGRYRIGTRGYGNWISEKSLEKLEQLHLYSQIKKGDYIVVSNEDKHFHALAPNSMAKVTTVLKDQELKFVVEGISKRTGNTIEQTIYKDHIKAAWREPEQTTEQKPALTDEAITELADKINFIKRLKSELNILEARKEDLEETLTETEESLQTMKDDLGVE